MKPIFIFTFFLAIHNFALALDKTRWTPKDQQLTELSLILAKISEQVGYPLSAADFILFEEKKLQGMDFSFYRQQIAGVPVRDAGVRLWVSGGKLLQMTAFTQNPTSGLIVSAKAGLRLENLSSSISFAEAQKLAADEIPKVRQMKSSLQWMNEKPVLFVQIYGKDRWLELQLDPGSKKVLSRQLRLYPRADEVMANTNQADEFSVVGRAFKVNEEFELPYGRKASGAVPELVELKYLKKQYKGSAQDWTQQLPQTEFPSSMMDDAKAATPEGRAEGYWSETSLQQMIREATQILPVQNNDVASGARLVGRYVSVAIDKEAFNKFQVTSFRPFYSERVNRSYEGAGDSAFTVKLNAATYGKPFYSAEDLQSRKAPYELIRDTAAMINEGFDEMQVYWSVNQWFELMQQAGFRDQELSTRPVTAFLFDPSIGSQDNAYYDSDTINFTTYTERNGNEARNLVTVWHELGHGLMDRLQGSSGFDNGGLSEGIADFAAEITLRGMYGLTLPAAIEDRRIVNNIGFNLTNEGHDDGEAYGGVLRDLMDVKIKSDGLHGYAQVSDLVLDAMRLTRQSPNLSVQEWFDALVLADELGKTNLRIPGEFAILLANTYRQRNFVSNSADFSKMILSLDGQEITESSAGARGRPVPVPLAAGQSKDFNLNLKMKLDPAIYSYPLKVVASFKNTNALQGAMRFKNEEDQVYMVNSEADILTIPLTVLPGCDFVNTGSGLCKDFVNVQVFSGGQSKPFAKKRFYLGLRSAN